MIYVVIVTVDTEASCQRDRPVQLIAESGLISGSALLDSGRRCVWQVSVGRGQRVRLRPDVFRPGVKSLVLGGGNDGAAGPASDDGTACPWSLTVDGGAQTSAVRVPLCSRTNDRRESLECVPRGPQQTCSVFLDWPDGFVDDEFPVFVVHYEGIASNTAFLDSG